MIGAFRIEAYVIASADGMIADASGVQPASLQFEADRRHFESGLQRADAIVNGRHSAEPHPDAPDRRRLILTRGSRPRARSRQCQRAALNSAGASLEEACEVLGLNSGTIAVIGGPQVFTLFLKLGYDCFHMSRAVKVRLPGGQPVFSRDIFGGDPDAALAGAGLKPRPPQWLDEGLTLTDWERSSP